MNRLILNRRQFLAGTAGIVAGTAGFPRKLLAASSPADIGPGDLSWEEVAQRYVCPEWFREVKFGVWSHWGPQAVPRRGGGWYARHMYMPDVGTETWGKEAYSYHCATYGHPSEVGFKDVIHQWKAENFDADAIVRQAKQVWGARYFVATANHHDHFDCFASSHHPWNSVNMGPKRDIVGEFGKAARRHGLRFGITSHDNRHWSWWNVAFGADKTGPKAGVPYDGHKTKADGKGQWWEGFDPADLYGPPPARRTPDLERQMKENWVTRHFELVDKYRPDLLYYDWCGFSYERYGQLVGARLHSNSLRRKGRIDTVLTIKIRAPGCVYDVERGGSEKLEPLPWQTETTFQDWFYKEDVEPRHDARTITEALVDAVSKNGNLLLNVELKPDGTYPEYHLGVMRRVGNWLKTNGKAIYETRPWKIFGEGPATRNAKAGEHHFNERTLKSPPYEPDEVRFTTKGRRLYLFVLNPRPGPVAVPSLGLNAATAPGRVKSITCLHGQRPMRFEQSEGALSLQVPESVETGLPAGFKIAI